jgi:DNA-binding transcriptional LysR family regulator
MKIDLNQLAIFVAIAETSGISAAAKRLGMPKSSVSRGLSSLESFMRVQLVHRTTRSVSLSTAGAALYERLSPLFHSIERSVAELPEREHQPSGVLRITCPVDFGSTVVAEMLARFLTRYPAIQVEVHVSNNLVDLVAEGFDLAIRISQRRMRDSSLIARSVGTLSTQLFAAPQYLARRGTPRAPRDLMDHEWVMYRGSDTLRLEGPGGATRITLRGRLSCDDMFFVRSATLGGAGIGVLPTFHAEADVLAGRLVRVLPRFVLPSGNVWIVHPSGRNVPGKVTAFRDFLLESLKARPLV